MIPPAAGGLYPTCFADFVGNLVKLRGRREKRERERERDRFFLPRDSQSVDSHRRSELPLELPPRTVVDWQSQ